MTKSVTDTTSAIDPTRLMGFRIIVDTEAGDTVLGAKQGRKDLGRPATLMAAKIGLKAGSKVT
ncbi:MAG: hypothetical protein CL813_00960 [Confluentimicrobium sp.]|nr:hypothetical protein [Actibacterium sp.]MBF51516.1 hypothetical protein [Actibacterium sp.]